jgi:hypothetical protein
MYYQGRCYQLFAAVTRLVEGLSLETLLILKVEKSVICLVGTRRPTVSILQQQYIWFLKTLMRNKAWEFGIKRSKILSRVPSHVVNNCGFWIRWIYLLNLHQSKLHIIITLSLIFTVEITACYKDNFTFYLQYPINILGIDCPVFIVCNVTGT